MMKREYIGGIGLAFLIAVLFLPTVAVASPALPPTTVVIGWQVTGSPEKSGTIDTGLSWADIYAHPTTTYAWNLSSTIAVDLGDDGIAHIDGLSIGVKADPFIDFGFSARSADGPTHFTFTSNLLIVNPALAAGAQGSAWAQVIPGFGNSVVSGDFGSDVYRSEYNGGTVFADLVSAPVYGYGYGVAPSTSISSQVSSMQVQWGLTVSSGGQASGNSHFQIMGDTIPEPATMALLGLGGLALIRKRRA